MSGKLRQRGCGMRRHRGIMALRTRAGKPTRAETITMHMRVLTAIVVLAACLPACQRRHAKLAQEQPPVLPEQRQPEPPQGGPAAPPEMLDMARALSRLSPENTLARLPRSHEPPAPVDSLARVSLDTWSQVGVADGYVRRLVYSFEAQKFWIEETGGFTGEMHWYGPLAVEDGVVISASAIGS
jgi:hypothetical protein